MRRMPGMRPMRVRSARKKRGPCPTPNFVESSRLIWSAPPRWSSSMRNVFRRKHAEYLAAARDHHRLDFVIAVAGLGNVRGDRPADCRHVALEELIHIGPHEKLSRLRDVLSVNEERDRARRPHAADETPSLRDDGGRAVRRLMNLPDLA